MHRIVAICVTALVFAYSAAASAGVVYSYAGNSFTTFRNDPIPAGAYDASMNLTGWIELAAPLAPNTAYGYITPSAYSFSDDRFTYTNLNSNVTVPDTSFAVGTDGSGAITGWLIGLERIGIGYLWSCGGGGDCVWAGGITDLAAVEPNGQSPTTQRDDARVVNNPGTWSVSAVPAPGSVLLLAAGLGCLLLLLGFRPHLRKENHVADARTVGQQHY